MHEISVKLSDKQIEQLERLAAILKQDLDVTAKMILTAGCAYLADATRDEAPDDVISVVIHGLLKAPRLPAIDEREFN